MKSQVCLYIDVEVKQEAQNRGINLSHSFEELIKLKLSNKANQTDKEKIDNLNALLLTKISEIEKLKKELKELNGYKEASERRKQQLSEIASRRMTR